MKLLFAEDDPQTASFVRKGLEAEGYSVDHVESGKDALLRATMQSYDLLLLDRMMPELDGLSLVKALRASKITTPILLLTALGGVDDRVAGLQAGADDYLVKPFASAELSARLQALARRPTPQADANPTLEVADLRIDLVSRSVTRAGQPIELQPREYRLLEHLMRTSGRVQTRNMLLEAVWDFHFDPETSVIETHISRLRLKVDKPFDRPLIHTVRGAGYTLKP